MTKETTEPDKNRKPAPEVTDTQDEQIDRPRKRVRVIDSEPPAHIRASLTKPFSSEPKPRNWGEQLDWTRHKFAQWLVVGALCAILALSVAEYMWPREDQTFSGTIDIFQIIATTALGYVLGRSDSKDDNQR